MHWDKVLHESGELTWKLLVFTIFIGLAQKIWPKKWFINNIIGLRKYTGIFCWLIALTHAGAEMTRRGAIGSATTIANAAFSTEHAMIFGSIAFLLMLPLFITSTNYAVKTMGYKAWKRLHMLTHVAFIFAALHIALIDYFRRGKIELEPLGPIALYIIGYGYLWFKKRTKA